MKALISHLVRQHLPQIAAQSLLNCHVRGLHSIMFLDTPEQRVRLFIATEQHELWRNNLHTLGSLAAHPHHCAITLHCISGWLVNLEYAPAPAVEWPRKEYAAYTYQSALLAGSGNFVKADAPAVVFHDARTLGAGDTLALPANLIHSVQIGKGKVAAWFVYEGKEDAGYTSLSYSDQPLEQASFNGLYGKMSEAQVLEILRQVNLLD